MHVWKRAGQVLARVPRARADTQTRPQKPPLSAPVHVHVLASLRLRRHLSAAGGEDAEDSGLLKQISVLRGDGSPPFQFQKLI